MLSSSPIPAHPLFSPALAISSRHLTLVFFVFLTGDIDFEEFLGMMTAKMGERDSREEILKAFRLFDDDETGKISFKNLKRVAKELGENMTDEELQEMIDEADRDGDGEINEEEFLRIMKKTSLY